MLTWLKYHGRWMLALLVAGVASCWTRHGWHRIAKAFLLWFGLLKHRGPQTSPDIYALRIQTCEKCPLFYAKLRTCGTPLKRMLRPYGCWCYMPEAAKLNEKQCYLDAEIEPGYPGGWTDAITRARHV